MDRDSDTPARLDIHFGQNLSVNSEFPASSFDLIYIDPPFNTGKTPDDYTFRYDEIDRIPYMAPGLVTKEKAAHGKTPTDTWWRTIVSPIGKEKTGYPTQKPPGIINRIIRVHIAPGDRVLDFLAGSGTLGEAAIRQGRSAVLVDSGEEAMAVMAKRLAFAQPQFHG